MIRNKKMCTNKFSIGGLIGVHVSIIVTWGYHGNFKHVYFFYEKILRGQEHVTSKNEPTKQN